MGIKRAYYVSEACATRLPISEIYFRAGALGMLRGALGGMTWTRLSALCGRLRGGLADEA